MKITTANYEILTPIYREAILKSIEIAGRTCYKSEDKITESSASAFVKMLINREHEAMIEHANISVKFVCDRGVTHEIVRHRLASYGQESTRYCNYSKDKFGNEITVILPCFFKDVNLEKVDNYLEDYNKPLKGKESQLKHWLTACRQSEKNYFGMLEEGASPQEARSVLPNSLKTEIVVTMNMREWRHFLKLRTEDAAHPQMRELTIPLLNELKKKLPELFGDL